MPHFDTSALVPLFYEDHPNHARAKAAFASADEVVLHACVVLELTTVVRRLAKAAGKDGNLEARQALAAILREPRVRLQDGHEAAVELYLADPRISFTDAIIAVSGSPGSKEEPVAFDEAIWKAAAIPRDKRARARKTVEAGLRP